MRHIVKSCKENKNESLCVDGVMGRRPPLSSTGGGLAVAVHAGDQKRRKQSTTRNGKPAAKTSNARNACAEAPFVDGTRVARETFDAVAKALLAGPQVSIDPHSVEVRLHTEKFCPKGRCHGQWTLELQNAFVMQYLRLYGPGTLFVVQRMGDDHFRFGISHPPETVCSVDDLGRMFPSWASHARSRFPSLPVHEFEDLTQDVFVKAAEGLKQGRFIIHSPHAFLNTMARNLQINLWKCGRKTISLSSEFTAEIPSREAVLEVLEIADEMAALKAIGLQPETLRLLRDELVRIDPTGVILLLGKYLRKHAPESISRFYDAWTRNGGDPVVTAAELGISVESIRTCRYRLRAFFLQHRDHSDDAV